MKKFWTCILVTELVTERLLENVSVIMSEGKSELNTLRRNV